MGRGTGAVVPPSGPISPAGPMPQPTTGPNQTEQELEILRAQAQEIGTQLQAINLRISELEHGGFAFTLTAVVKDELCTACGTCIRVCSTNAISLNDIAQIDQEKCNGCGRCVVECPNKAISLQKI